MRIAFLVNSLTAGGAEKVVLTLLNKLIRDNYNIELICMEKNNFYELPKNVKITYLSNNSGNASGIKKMLLIPYFAYKLKKYVKNNNIIIVQSHLYRANYINVMSQFFGSTHQSQIVNHGIISRYNLKGILGKINLFLIKYLYSKANLIIFISKAMKKDYNNLYNSENNQIVINNPYDIRTILDLKNEAIDNFKFLKDKKYLITMGRLISLKRYKDVINALKYLDENIDLILLGDGDEKENLKTLATSLDLNDRIHFIGNVTNPFKYLAKSDLFILSSETEGFPNSVIEALSCNIPVISSDCISGPREILSPMSSINLCLIEDIEVTKYGVLYPVANIELLVKSIRLIINDNLLRNELSESSLNRANEFSVEKIIDKYKKVLEIE